MRWGSVKLDKARSNDVTCHSKLGLIRYGRKGGVRPAHTYGVRGAQDEKIIYTLSIQDFKNNPARTPTAGYETTLKLC